MSCAAGGTLAGEGTGSATSGDDDDGNGEF
jgi:hypothetical protein